MNIVTEEKILKMSNVHIVYSDGIRQVLRRFAIGSDTKCCVVVHRLIHLYKRPLTQ